MVKYREILRLHAMGVSIRNIAFSCRCSTATVRAVTGRAKAAGIDWPLPEEMGDRAIREVIYPPKSKADPDKAPIDHDHVDAEMSRPGVTMMLLWSEYCESAVSQGRSPYMYSAFCERHRKWAMSRKTAMRIAHKPAEQMQVQVGHALARSLTDVGHEPVAALCHAQRMCDAFCRGKHGHQGAPVRFGQRVRTLNVPLGNHEHMHRRLRIDIIKRQHLVILVCLLRWDAPIRDLTEQTIFHTKLLSISFRLA